VLVGSVVAVVVVEEDGAAVAVAVVGAASLEPSVAPEGFFSFSLETLPLALLSAAAGALLLLLFPTSASLKSRAISRRGSPRGLLAAPLAILEAVAAPSFSLVERVSFLSADADVDLLGGVLLVLVLVAVVAAAEALFSVGVFLSVVLVLVLVFAVRVVVEDASAAVPFLSGLVGMVQEECLLFLT